MRETALLTICDWLDSVAPFDIQEEYDNSGLIINQAQDDLAAVLLALDVTPKVIDEAMHLGAKLIIAHHPLMFQPVQTIDMGTYDGFLITRLIREGISLVCVHTNADKSLYSGSRAVASMLLLKDIRQAGDYLVLGELPQPMRASNLCELIGCTLGGAAEKYTCDDHLIHTLAVAGGAYSEGYDLAMQAGAQALLTGEVRHHHALAAAWKGFTLIAGGHYYTEAPMLHSLANGLQNHMDALEYNISVHVSGDRPY